MQNNGTEKFNNYSAYTAAEDIKRLRFITEAVNEKSTDNKRLRVLDVGCGNGNVSIQIANYGHAVLAIDISPDTIVHASEVNAHPNIKYRCLAVEDFEIEAHFDVIICSEVLEHLQNPASILDAIYRCLDCDGIAIIAVPNGRGPRELLVTRPVQSIMQHDNLISKMIRNVKNALGFNGYTPQSSAQNLDHVQFFTRKGLCNMLNSHGFIIEKVRAINFLEKVFPFSIVCKKSMILQEFDCSIADALPLSWSSGFITLLKKRRKSN